MSGPRPLASVVINNYNYGRYLSEAIESALAQTYAPVEVIVVDDGSTDESREVIARYDGRIVPLLKANGGQGSALNAGFAASRGQMVIFLDADDQLLPTAVERAMELLLEPSVTKVHWPLWEMDAGGTPTGRIEPPWALPEGDLREIIIREGPTGCGAAPTSGNAWSRSFLERVLPMPEPEFRINSDGYLVTLAPIYGQVRTVPEPQAFYRIHGDNYFASRSPGDKRRRHYEMYVHRCEALARHLEALGLPADPEPWLVKRELFYLWPKRRSAAQQQLSGVIPEGERFILVDEEGWNDGSSRREVAGREYIPFLERNGEYWGQPSDDVTAVAELERLRREREPGFIVFTWDTFWWLEEYPRLNRYLRSGFPCLLSNTELIVFDLRHEYRHE